MSDKTCEQWFIEVPWGKLAMVSWGDAENQPVLCVHGFMDSAASFILLVERLPDFYYYVSLDFPGHGFSDPYPAGFLPSQVHLVDVIKTVVNRMGWKNFIYIGHSIAYLLGIFYNAVYPYQISKMINIDPGPTLALSFPETLTAEAFIKKNCESRHYPYDEATRNVMRRRKLSEDQAKVVLSRILVPMGDGKFRLSFDAKMGNIRNFLLPLESLRHMMSNVPPSLNIVSTDDIAQESKRSWIKKLMREVADVTPHIFTVSAAGGHDVHITNPEEVALHIDEFLKKEFCVVRSKI